MTTTKETTNASTATVKADKVRIDRLKEQLRSTPAAVDFERIRIMEEVYAATEGDQNIMRRAKFMATLLERKKIYIDENLFVGSMASTVNGIYTYPEWNIDWMKDDKTVEKRDKTINEPVQFYMAGSRQPYEIVVNQVKKDQVIGYLATPKMKLARR